MRGTAERSDVKKSVAESRTVHRSLFEAIRVPFPAGEEAISKFLGIPACELWPDRFNEDGSRKTSRRNKYTKIRVRRQGLKRHAA